MQVVITREDLEQSDEVPMSVWSRFEREAKDGRWLMPWGPKEQVAAIAADPDTFATLRDLGLVPVWSLVNQQIGPLEDASIEGQTFQRCRLLGLTDTQLRKTIFRNCYFNEHLHGVFIQRSLLERLQAKVDIEGLTIQDSKLVEVALDLTGRDLRMTSTHGYQVMLRGKAHAVNLAHVKMKSGTWAMHAPHAIFASSTFTNFRFEGVDFSRSRWSDMRFSNALFRDCRFEDASWEGSTQSGATFVRCSGTLPPRAAIATSAEDAPAPPPVASTIPAARSSTRTRLR